MGFNLTLQCRLNTEMYESDFDFSKVAGLYNYNVLNRQKFVNVLNVVRHRNTYS